MNHDRVLRSSMLPLAFAAAAAFCAAPALAADRGVLVQNGDRLSAAIVSGDEDAFDLELAEGGKVSIEVAASKGSELRPEIRLCRPDGTELPLGTALRGVAGRKLRVANVTVPDGGTGRWQLRVGGADGTAGAYRVSARVVHPRSVKVRKLDIPAGGSVTIPFPGTDATVVRGTLRGPKGSPLASIAVVDPSGAELEGSTVIPTGRPVERVPNKLVLAQGLGDYALSIAGSPDSATRVDVTLSLRFPRVKRRTATLPAEPVANPADPVDGVVQEGVAIAAELPAAGLLPGSLAVVEGTGVTVRTLEVGDGGTATLVIDVAPDAPYGPRRITVFPPELLGESFVLDGAIAVVAPVPQVTAIGSGPVKQGAAGVHADVEGSGFRPGGTVSVAGAGLIVNATEYVSPSLVRVTFAADILAPIGMRDVLFTQPAEGGGAASAPAPVLRIVYADPAIASVASPVVRQDDTDHLLVVSGSNFRAGGTVSVSGTGVTVSSVVVVDTSTLEARLDTASDAAYGLRDLTYTQPSDGGAAQATLTGAVSVRAPNPSVTTLLPGFVRQRDQGAIVSVRGTGFRAGGTVAIAGPGLTVGATTIVSATEARVSVDAASDALVSARTVTYTQPAVGGGAGASLVSGLAIHHPLPGVSSVSQTTLRQDDTNVVVTLSGSNFRAGGTVAVSGADVTASAPTWLSDTSFQVALSVASQAAYGARDVTYTQPAVGGGASASLPGALTILAPVPSVASASPAVVKQAGTTTLTVSGAGFRSGGSFTASGAGLTLGTTTVVSATQATVDVAAASDATIGARSLTFTQAAAGGGASATASAAFSVAHPDPVLTSVSPVSVRQEQTGVALTLTGNHFRTGGSVAVSGPGITVSAPTWLSDTSFRVTLAVAADASYGARTVTYTQPAGGGAAQVALAGGLTVLAPAPTVTAAAPAIVKQAGATTLTLTGTGFRSGGVVSVSGAGLTVGATIVVSATQATVSVSAAADATIGARDVTFTQAAPGGSDAATLASAFAVHHPDPSLSGASPSIVRQEQTGVSVTLTGAHFRSGGTVAVSGTGVTVSAPTWLSDTSFRVTLDIAASAAFGARSVTYTQPAAGGGAQAVLASAISVRAPIPTVTATTPATVQQLGTVTLSVTGTGFRTGGALSASGTGLTFGATTIVSATQATVQVTAATSAAIGARDVVYTQPAAGGSDAATKAGALTVHHPDPTITAASPAVIRQGTTGATVTLTGTHFRSGGTVTVSGTGVTVSAATWVSDTSFSLTLGVGPLAAYGARSVTYTQPAAGGGATATLASALTVHAPNPTLTSSTPAIVQQGQTSVTIDVAGTGLRSDGTVTLTGTGVTLVSTNSASETQISLVVDVAAGAAYGSRNIVYTQAAAGGGASATLVAAFTVNAPDPTVTSVSPATIKQNQTNQTITVAGTGFRAGGAITVSGTGITLGATTIVSATQATVQATVASTATVGARSVTYTQPVAGGGAAATAAAALTVLNPDPILTAVAPTSLRQEQTGVTLTLTGNHFRAGGTVSVSGPGVTLTSPTWNSDTSFSVQVAVAADATFGTRSVTYTQPAGGGGASVTLASGVRIDAPAPVVSSVSPTAIVQGTGPTTFTVTGTGFRSGGALTVSGTGLTLGTTTFVSATQATVAVTASASATMGPRDVVWTQPAAGGGATGTGTGALAVHAPTPTLTAITPARATQGTSGTFTLTGTNFRAGGTVSVGTGITATNATWLSDTSFQVTLSLAASTTLGPRAVVYAQPAVGGSASAAIANGFQVDAPAPTVTAASPATIQQGASAVTITVTGTNFSAGGVLSVSGTGLTLGATTVVSATQATVAVTAASSAPIGPRSVTFTQSAIGGGASATGASLLTVLHPAPTLASASPTAAEQGATGTLTLTGTNFRAGGTVTTTGAGVTLSSPTWVSDTSFTVAFSVTATAATGSRDLTYTQPAAGGGASVTRTGAYSVTPAGPTLTSITPSFFFPGDVRTSARVVGANFNSGTTVSFSGSGITVHSAAFVNSTTLDLDLSFAADATVGARSITITPATGGGPAKTFTSAITVAPADPAPASFSHVTLSQGAASIAITVTGANFRSGDTIAASGSGVTFGTATVTGTSTLSATATVSASAATGLRNIVVTHVSSDGGRSGTLTGAFTVTGAAPTVTSVGPTAVGVTGTGGATREVPLTITGTNFMTGATVAFSKTSGTGVSVTTGTTSVVSPTSMTVTIALTGTATTGLWNVLVTNPGTLGNSGTSGNNKLDVKSATTLAVNRVIASSGGPFGGERVTIQGSGFANGYTVDFGSVRAAGTQVIDGSTIVTTVPQPTSASRSGPTSVNVVVNQSATVSATLTNGWAYGADTTRFVTRRVFPAQGATAVPKNLKSAVIVLSAPANASSAVYGTSTGTTAFWFESGGSFTTGGTIGFGPGGRFLVYTRPGTGNLAIANTGVYVLDIPTAMTSLGGNRFTPTRLAVTATNDQQTFTLSATGTDTTAPTLTTIVPANGATAVSPTAQVVLTFSEDIDPLTVTATNVAFLAGTTVIPASLSLSEDLRTVTITPQSELAASTTYTTTLGTGLADLCGNGFTSISRTFTTSGAADTTAPTIDAVVIEDLPSSLDGSGTYVNSSGTAGQAFDAYLPRSGWSVAVRFSDAGGAGVDDTTFSARCSVAVGSAAANAELASNFSVSSTGASWRIPSSAQVATGENIVFTFTVRDKSGNTSSSSSVTIDVADRDSTATYGGDLDPVDTRRTWILRSDLDAFTASYSTTTTPGPQQGATTTVAANGVPDIEEALRLIGMQSTSMTTAAAAATNGADTGTNAIVARMFLRRVRELLNERFGIAADGTRGADSVDVEFLLGGEQGSLASLPVVSTANSSNSTKAFSEISIGGTNGADSGAYTASGTLGTAWFDNRNRREEANLNTGGGSSTGIYLLGMFELQVNTNALFRARISNVLVAVHGGTPVGQHASDDDVLAGSFVRTTSTDATHNARYDAIMDALEHAALYTSAVTAHEIGHSLGLVPDGPPKTGLFGAAHHSNTFTEATSAAPNTSGHLDFLGNDLMAGSTSFDTTTWTGAGFKRFSPMDIAYLLNRLIHDEGK